MAFIVDNNLDDVLAPAKAIALGAADGDGANKRAPPLCVRSTEELGLLVEGRTMNWLI